uniref:hypothetical protein n=1 Tax=Nocardiopsis kunsanensis TaxID=141693 RepID=UPI00373AE7FB
MAREHQEARQEPQRVRERRPRTEQPREPRLGPQPEQRREPRNAPAREPEQQEQDRDRGDDQDSSSGSGVPMAGGGASSATTAMILHAITVLCCFNWLFGVAGIVFAVRAGHARDRGMPVKAETLTRYSWYCLGAAGVMIFVMLVLTFVVFTQAGSWLQEITGLVPY